MEKRPLSELIQQATIYDVEVEQKTGTDHRLSLPKRVRFYHAKIDAGSLKSGESYHSLKRVIIIMIVPYDPFGRNRMIYTIRNLCEEEPQMEYDDGARTIFLYTKGVEGNPPEEIKNLLQYMEHSTRENAANEDLQIIHEMVETVKKDREVSIAYMKIFEREEMLVQQGIKQGHREEQANTERERIRADAAEEELRKLEEELRKLKGQLGVD